MNTSLDNPIWSALTTRHRALALRRGLAACYPAEVSPLAALAEPTRAALADLAAIAAGGSVVAVAGVEDLSIPSDVWEPLGVLPLHQMVCAEPLESPKLEVIPLSPADVPEMLQLVEATQPGPFALRTIELGRYVGVRDRGRLVAMAGERLSLEGYTEVSAVCTDPEFRGQGLGEGLVRVIGSGIQRAGRIPFLHVLEANLGAIGLYQKLGFEGRGTRPLTTLLRR